MQNSRPLHLVASTAATAALAIASVVLAPDSPAVAATASQGATYLCTTPGGTTFQLPATVSLDDLPSTLTAGLTVPAGTPFSLDLDANTLAAVLGTTVLAGDLAVDQVATRVGATSVTRTVVSPVLTQLGAGLLGIDGTLGSFVPNASSLGLPIPTSFDLVSPLLGVPGLGVGASCTLAPGSVGGTTDHDSGSVTVGGVTVVKQKAKLKAHQVGTRPKLVVKVKNQTGKAAGKVIAKAHGKKVGHGTLKNGTVRLKLKRLHQGLTKVRVRYVGDDVTRAAHRTVKVRLTRR